MIELAILLFNDNLYAYYNVITIQNTKFRKYTTHNKVSV